MAQRLSRKKKRWLQRHPVARINVSPRGSCSRQDWFTSWFIWNLANHVSAYDPAWPRMSLSPGEGRALAARAKTEDNAERQASLFSSPT